MSRTRPNNVNNLMTYFQTEWVSFELMILDDYIREQEMQFERKIISADERYYKFEKDLKAGIVDGSTLYHEHIRDSIQEEIWKIEGNYKQFFRQSQIIQLYSVLEHKLRDGCDIFSTLKKTAYSVRDLNGSSDMDKTKKFMVKSMGLDIQKLEPEWSFFQNIRKLRNIIVHHNSELSDNNGNFAALNKFQQGRFDLKKRNRQSTAGNRPIWYEIRLNEKSFLLEITSKMETLLINIGSQEVK